MRERLENPELKPYIEEFIISKLENCELFVNTYGTGFVKQRLDQNFKILYTEGQKEDAKGEYHLGSSGIISIFEQGANGQLLTFEEIEEKKILDTVLHEGIHAVFNKTLEECNALGIQIGSGIHEVYGNKVELGRGFNEGYTNWVCEKAGIKTLSYYEFTNFIKILELAIGPEKVMQFGNGNIINNIAPLFEMSAEDTTFLLAKGDSIYDYNHKVRAFKKIASLLNEKNELEKRMNGTANLEEIPDWVDISKKLNALEEYINIEDDDNYILYAKEHSMSPEDDTTKESYFKHMKDYYSDKSKELKEEVEADLISKYFKKELEDILASNDFSIDQYKKFSKLFTLIDTCGKSKNAEIIDFEKKIDKLKIAFFEKTKKEISLSIKDGSLTPEKVIDYRNMIVDDDYRDDFEFNRMLANQMLPENPEVYRSFFEKLTRYDIISEMFDYKLLELQTSKGSNVNLFLNMKNNNHFSTYLGTPNIINANDELEENEDIFDITLNNLQSMQEIVRSFLKLKEQLCEENPNTKLQIVNSVVIVSKEGKEPEFYIVEGNDIVLAEAKELLTQHTKTNNKDDNQNNFTSKGDSPKLQVENLDVDREKENSEVNGENRLKPISQNPFKKFFMKILDKFARKRVEPALANYEDKEDINELSDEELEKVVAYPQSFDSRIHVETTPIYKSNPVVKTEKENKELDK